MIEQHTYFVSEVREFGLFHGTDRGEKKKTEIKKPNQKTEKSYQKSG